MILTTKVKNSSILKEIAKRTDYFIGEEPEIKQETKIPDFNLPEAPFGIGLLVGPSGSGKSSILKTLGKVDEVMWDQDTSIADHFESYEQAASLLGASGLNSIPTWVRPYHTLSNGEQHRADLSRQIKNNAVIDEFTSVVDRNVAKSCSAALSKYVKRNAIEGVILATCHYDVIDWLEPDWVFDCGLGEFLTRGLLRRPTIHIKLTPCSSKAWSFFSRHHYLSGSINRSSRCWIAEWDGVAVGFASAIAFPSGSFKNAWRGHRTVILPEFQGLGLGARISDAIGEIFVSQGCRYFSKTAHPALGQYRQNSDRWKPTTKNLKKRADYKSGRPTKEDKHKLAHADRLCFSHEYTGINP